MLESFIERSIIVGQVVVGIDGSASANAALHWAAREAGRYDAEVVALRSWSDPLVLGPSLTDAWKDPTAGERQARADMVEEVDAVAEAYPEVRFISELVADSPATALVAASEKAPLVVVGSRGRGGFASLLLGSVGQRVAMAAESTVVVVREPEHSDGLVVVGVDGSESSRHALTWAAEAARHRGCALRVVMAWSYLAPVDEHGSAEFRADYTEADAWKALTVIVDETLGTDVDLEVDLQAICDLPARALLEQAADASLLVVGPQGWSRHARVGLGSITIQVLHHAPCPLAIVRPVGTTE